MCNYIIIHLFLLKTLEIIILFYPEINRFHVEFQRIIQVIIRLLLFFIMNDAVIVSALMFFSLFRHKASRELLLRIIKLFDPNDRFIIIFCYYYKILNTKFTINLE